MSSEKVRFEGSGGEALVGRLDLPPDDAPLAYALFAHCFTCSKDLKAVVSVSRALAAARVAVFRFDFTGLGESEGDFADTSFSSNVEDLVAAARFLEREREAPRLLVGHSLGGAAVLKAARDVPSATAVATIGAPADPEHVSRLVASSREEIERTGEAEVEIAGRRFTIRRQFLEDLEEQSMREAIGGLDRALLVFHSPLDRVVGIENAERIYRAAKHPKSFVSLDRADHLLTDPADAEHAARVLAAWARRYIAAAEGRPEASTDREGGVAARIGAGGFRTELLAGGHALVADEPASAGGTDAGPSPYDLLTAALGACTAMTLRLYADRKEWPLEGATVRLAHRKVHAEDCAECEEGAERRLDEIERRLSLDGPLDEGQRERLLEIAGRCPVHRTLEAGSRIVTSLEEAEGGKGEEAGSA